jgi:hypothetical protein
LLIEHLFDLNLILILQSYLSGSADALDRVDASDGDTVAGHDLVAEVLVNVEGDVARDLAVGHILGSLLEFECLRVHALAGVGKDEEGV